MPPEPTSAAEIVGVSSDRRRVDPLGLLLLLLGCVLGWQILDRAYSVGALAWFARTNDAAFVAKLDYAFAILPFTGAALAIPAPRAAAATFALAGLLGLFLGTVTLWQGWLTWTGPALLVSHQRATLISAGAAFVLAFASRFGHRQRRRVRRPRRPRARPEQR